MLGLVERVRYSTATSAHSAGSEYCGVYRTFVAVELLIEQLVGHCSGIVRLLRMAGCI